PPPPPLTPLSLHDALPIFAKDPMYRNDVLAISLITFGLILVNPSFSFHDQATIGLLWGIFSGFSFALFTFLNRTLSQQASALQIDRKSTRLNSSHVSISYA